MMSTIAFTLSLLISTGAALALIGVGATVVRRALPTSGYLFIAAGALKLFMSCCGVTFGTSETVREVLVHVASLRVFLTLQRLASTGTTLLVGVLFVAALVGLAGKVRKQSADRVPGDKVVPRRDD